jgi:hypothetical protein
MSTQFLMAGTILAERKKNLMKQDNRVLGRKGARELTATEVDHVTGAVHTETKCSLGPHGLDGDVNLGEC